MLSSPKIKKYEEVLRDWNIQTDIGRGSAGTIIYRIIRKGNERFEETHALKAIPITNEYGDFSRLSDCRREDYWENRSKLAEYALGEVERMADLCGRTNIVNYFDYIILDWEDQNEFGCDLLIQMELLHDLRSELKNGRFFKEAEVIQIGKDICSALVVCHGKDILHRDIKPENIFFNDDGDYKLGDFGIAKILEKRNYAGSMVGTFAYATPEQHEGKPYDLQADIYSLGLVLYELANQNRLPFAKSAYVTDSEVIKRINTQTLPNPCGSSPELTEIILKACAYAPSDRYRTAQEMLDALNQIHITKPVERRPSTVPVTNEPSDPGSIENSYDTEDALPDYIQVVSGQNAGVKRSIFVERVPKIFHITKRAESSQNSVAQQSDVSEEIRELLQKANSGDASAQNALGLHYFSGNGVDINYKDAFRWFRMAADKGNVHAMYNLGCCYFDGYGINKNYSFAVEWFQKAADKGNVDAINSLGYSYYYGYGVKKNYSLAALWYKKAANKGYTVAMYSLGCCYYYGHGVKKNYFLAVEQFQKAADKGEDAAMDILGDCYYSGKGVPKDLVKAMDYYLQAMKRGNTEAAIQYHKILTHSKKANRILLAEKGHTLVNLSDKQASKIRKNRLDEIGGCFSSVVAVVCIYLWFLNFPWWIWLGIVFGLNLIPSIFSEVGNPGLSGSNIVVSVLRFSTFMTFVTVLIIAAFKGFVWVWNWIS